MAKKVYDPLHFVPSPNVVREKLRETLSLADRLKALLELSERMNPPLEVTATTEDSKATTVAIAR